ncbi:5-formyltetrahydrofolate cyclo-ligase [Nocardioides dongxiaopingii]|uniref:5-formyltetrahydrofolate cyclo-ligase n=1 Tax=Nocardioides dongxiaopingii TaxID=2576036 RepID=UPI0010C76800|nr:5-formyltetrahydrofolate cyclo-ligase [Nocardioides dongxiaopingii]
MAPAHPPAHPPAPTPGPSPAKVALRDQVLTARNRLTPAEVGAHARALVEHVLAAPEVRRAATVAAYVSVGTEPGTGLLLDALLAAGRRVVLPVLLPDGDLDWAVHTGAPGGLAPARRGLLEPTSERLGVDAVATADVVLVPGLAVSATGLRMGRGGGSYDRALGRVPLGTLTCVLLYDAETDRAVPVEPHDRPVTAAATPAGLRRFAPTGPGGPGR